MDKNNLAVKLVYFYIDNLKRIKEMALNIAENAACVWDFLPELLINIFAFMFRIINIFIPINTIINYLRSRYLCKKDLIELGVVDPIYQKETYYSKKSIKEFKKQVEKEKDEDE